MNREQHPPRHVVHILPDGSAGGGATVVLGLCDDLRNRAGWRASVITQPDSYLWQAAAAAGATVDGMDFYVSRLDPRLPAGMQRILARLGPDLIHLHGSRAAMPFLRRPLSTQTCPLVLTVHGHHFLGKGSIKRWASRLVERRITRRADRVVFVSNADAQLAIDHDLIEAGDRRAGVIVNGIDPRDFPVAESIPPRYDMVFAGRLHPQKNPEFAIDVLEQMPDSRTTLLMIGDGPLAEPVRARIQRSPARDRITVRGALSRPDNLLAISAAKVFLFPSLWEGLPIAPIEALYCGLPVVASRIDGTTEIVEHEGNGLLVDTFCAADYAQAVSRLLGDEPLRRQLARNGRAGVEQRFLWDRVFNDYFAIYRQAIG